MLEISVHPALIAIDALNRGAATIDGERLVLRARGGGEHP